MVVVVDDSDSESGADNNDDGCGNGNGDDTCVGILLFMLIKLTLHIGPLTKSNGGFPSSFNKSFVFFI